MHWKIRERKQQKQHANYGCKNSKKKKKKDQKKKKIRSSYC